MKAEVFCFHVVFLYLTLTRLCQGSSRDAQSVDSCHHHSFPLRGLDLLPHQQGAEVQLAIALQNCYLGSNCQTFMK